MIGLYVHVPFCGRRCSYCDFYLVAGRAPDRARFVRAVVREIDAVAPPLRGASADTIHFGGGTPSILETAHLGGIVEALGRAFRIDAGAEIALEANPEDLRGARCRELAAIGVNRISLGVQTLDDGLLARLRRGHSAAEALAAVDAARAARIQSVGADLILGLPEEDPEAALAAIDRLAERGVDHVSLYLLEVHPRTRLGREAALGRLAPLDDDAAAALYDEAAARLEAKGFEHYEISNFARPGWRSRHNVKYWTDGEYLGFGPAAHSYLGGRRWSNAPDLDGYLARNGFGCERHEDPSRPTARAGEALIAGLRIAEGIDLEALRARYGEAVPVPGDPAIALLIETGLADLAGTRLRLTRRGRLLSNEVCERLLPAPDAAVPAFS